MPTNSRLWQRSKGFDIDNSGDERPFSARPAREKDWVVALARLIARGLHRTPSDDLGNDRSTGAHGRGYGGGYWGCEG